MTEYMRWGSCRRCGACCDPATLPARLEAYRRHGELLVLTQHPTGCPHLHRKNGTATCLTYQDRPLICRIFPSHPVDLEALPGCGFFFVQAP